jgi:hypothetical protein
MEAIADAIWQHCRTEATSLIVDDPRNIAAVAAHVARTSLGSRVDSQDSTVDRGVDTETDSAATRADSVRTGQDSGLREQYAAAVDRLRDSGGIYSIDDAERDRLVEVVLAVRDQRTEQLANRLSYAAHVAADERGRAYNAEQRAEQLEIERDQAYRERAHLLAWLAALHPANAVITPAPDVDEPGWQLLYLLVGGYQMSWHIAPRDSDLFNHVEHVAADDPRAQWDGHSTTEKYERIQQHTQRVAADRP